MFCVERGGIVGGMASLRGSIMNKPISGLAVFLSKLTPLPNTNTPNPREGGAAHFYELFKSAKVRKYNF